MTTMIFEVYDAFRAANVPEDKARRAAEVLFSESVATKGDVLRVERELSLVRTEIAVLKWMVGVVVAATVIPLIKPLLV